jgi:hypothetical protein
MKKLTSFLAAILSFVVCLSGVSPAFAQEAPQPPSRGITTFYATPEQQAEGVKVYNSLRDDVAIPNPDLSAYLPEDLSDFPAVYKKVLEQGREKNGTNGSFTEGQFDFQTSTPVVPRTNTLFTVNAPLNGRIYTVVAGLPAAECPLKIKETAIAFFDNVTDAEARAKKLDAEKYLVYVSPVDDLTIKAFSQLFYDQDTGKKKTNSECFLVSGATEQVTTDFQKIFPLLPQNLQQPAREGSFKFTPKAGNFIYLVNARKTLVPLVETVPSSSHPSIPSGLKEIALSDPNRLDSSSTNPIIQWNGYSYWAYSYIDNRVSLGIVAYDSNGQVVKQWEKPGTRYIYSIAVDSASKTFTFVGQSNQEVVVPWYDLQLE